MKMAKMIERILNTQGKINFYAAVLFFVLYVALFQISDNFFANVGQYEFINLLFLPAFVRLLGFLVIGFWIIPSLFFAALFCVDLELSFTPIIIVSIFLAVGGPLGTATVAYWLKLKPSLHNLSPLKLLQLSLGCALGNALFYQFGLYIVGYAVATPWTALTIVAGDVIGMWTAIYLLKFATLIYWR